MQTHPAFWRRSILAGVHRSYDGQFMVPGRRPVDLFRCESATLKSHWVMVVIDQFTRRIIGFAVQAGDCDGIAYGRIYGSLKQVN